MYCHKKQPCFNATDSWCLRKCALLQFQNVKSKSEITILQNFFTCYFSSSGLAGADSEDPEETLEGNDGICATTEWSQWSECSATCGVGFKSRSRQFKDRMGRKKCTHVIICKFS